MENKKTFELDSKFHSSFTPSLRFKETPRRHSRQQHLSVSPPDYTFPLNPQPTLVSPPSTLLCLLSFTEMEQRIESLAVSTPRRSLDPISHVKDKTPTDDPEFFDSSYARRFTPILHSLPFIFYSLSLWRLIPGPNLDVPVADHQYHYVNSAHNSSTSPQKRTTGTLVDVGYEFTAQNEELACSQKGSLAGPDRDRPYGIIAELGNQVDLHRIRCTELVSISIIVWQPLMRSQSQEIKRLQVEREELISTRTALTQRLESVKSSAKKALEVSRGMYV
jgi:hypothetical protein